MPSEFRRRALDLFSRAREETQYELKVSLLSWAQTWLDLADRKQRLLDLEAETERLTKPRQMPR